MASQQVASVSYLPFARKSFEAARESFLAALPHVPALQWRDIAKIGASVGLTEAETAKVFDALEDEGAIVKTNQGFTATL